MFVGENSQRKSMTSAEKLLFRDAGPIPPRIFANDFTTELKFYLNATCDENNIDNHIPFP